jgi:hypothetical protein
VSMASEPQQAWQRAEWAPEGSLDTAPRTSPRSDGTRCLWPLPDEQDRRLGELLRTSENIIE